MLPDSTTDSEGSIGFVQYRIKPQSGLPEGTIIENTAYIYFDYNDPIITNTTENHFAFPVSVVEMTKPLVSVFPNPGSGHFTLLLDPVALSTGAVLFEVFDLRGVRLHSGRISQSQ